MKNIFVTTSPESVVARHDDDYTVAICTMSKFEKGVTGGFLPRETFQPYQDINGMSARFFLADCGFTVIESGNTGSYGYAKTDCGVMLTTNGFIQQM